MQNKKVQSVPGLLATIVDVKRNLLMIIIKIIIIIIRMIINITIFIQASLFSKVDLLQSIKDLFT